MLTTQRDNCSPNLPPILLLVDDDDDDYYLLHQAVKAQLPAITLIHCSTAPGLLEWLRSLDRLPDLILLDFHMPQISGLELLILLKQQLSTRSIPVVMWSSFLDDQQQQQCYRAEASWVLLKPDNQLQLSGVITQFGQQWLKAAN